MSSTSKNVLLTIITLAILTLSVSVVVIITRASSESGLAKTSRPVRVNTSIRNLSFQPEAIRIARRLGKRFDTVSRAKSVTYGNLTTAEGQQPMIIIRRQTAGGETVELRLANHELSWTVETGAKAPGNGPTEAERLLLERLIFDSPDNFVLAQLRGASYLTVARNVRPPAASDDYNGSLWTIVRLDEPHADETVQLKSKWRLYYINSNTGLIDRIVSRLEDKTVEAQIVSWTEHVGEKVPAKIIWSIDGREAMSYQVTSVSYSN
jgi:hypothetical protein